MAAGGEGGTEDTQDTEDTEPEPEPATAHQQGAPTSMFSLCPVLYLYMTSDFCCQTGNYLTYDKSQPSTTHYLRFFLFLTVYSVFYKFNRHYKHDKTDSTNFMLVKYTFKY